VQRHDATARADVRTRADVLNGDDDAIQYSPLSTAEYPAHASSPCSQGY
jgi:hypothetical protein